MPQEITFADNSNPIPEPIFTNIRMWFNDQYTYPYFADETRVALHTAQYVYNLRQEYVKELEGEIEKLKGKIEQLVRPSDVIPPQY